MALATKSGQILSRLIQTDTGEIRWLAIEGRNNTIDSLLIDQLTDALMAHKEEQDTRVVVLHGSGNRFFSPGFHLHEVSRFDRPAMADFMKRFTSLSRLLYSHPRPTIAMINGEAIGGGCLLAACCDFRIASSHIHIGMSETSRFVLVPFGSLKILESRIGRRHVAECLYQGKCYSTAQALHLGLVNEVCAENDLKGTTVRLARRLSGQSLHVFRHLKRYLTQETLQAIVDFDNGHLEDFLDCWFHPNARAGIHQILTRLSGKGRAGKSKISNRSDPTDDQI